MRRLILALGLLLLAGPAWAQQFQQGSVLCASHTAVTVGNTTTATDLFSCTVPAFTQQNFTPQQFGATNLHLRALGTLTSNVGAGAVGTANVGCNYGGSTATITLANGATYASNLSSTPVLLDLWLRTTNAFAPGLTGRLFVYGASASNSNAGIATNGNQTLMATVAGTTSVLSPQTLKCTWQWASAATTNTVTINTTITVVGD